jgi:hypothetical protein
MIKETLCPGSIMSLLFFEFLPIFTSKFLLTLLPCGARVLSKSCNAETLPATFLNEKELVIRLITKYSHENPGM